MPVRTEDDLRQAFNSPLDEGAQQRLYTLIHELDRPRRRRSWAAPLAAAAAVAALAIAVTLVAGHSHRPAATAPATPVTISTPAPTSAPTSARVTPTPAAAPSVLSLRATAFALAPESGYTIGTGLTFTDSQTRAVLAHGVDTGMTITMYAKGKSKLQPSSTTVDVDGVSAHWATAPEQPGGPTVLAFSYATDGWITVQPAGTSAAERDAAVAVARAVRANQTTPLLVPATVGHVPNGLRLQAVVTSAMTRDGVGGTAGIDVLLDYERTTTPGTVMTIDISGLGLAGGDTGGSTVVIAGQNWQWRGGILTLRAADHIIRIDGSLANLPLSQVQQVAAGLHLTTAFGDQRTWYDARTALG